MIIHCRCIGCMSKISVDLNIKGVSATERGYEVDGSFTPPLLPWRPHALGGYTCSDDCAKLESFSMGSRGR